MRNQLLTFLTALFLLQGCSFVKGLFGKKGIMDPDDPNFLNNIQKLKENKRSTKSQSINQYVERNEATQFRRKYILQSKL